MIVQRSGKRRSGCRCIRTTFTDRKKLLLFSILFYVVIIIIIINIIIINIIIIIIIIIFTITYLYHCNYYNYNYRSHLRLGYTRTFPPPLPLPIFVRVPHRHPSLPPFDRHTIEQSVKTRAYILPFLYASLFLAGLEIRRFEKPTNRRPICV